MVLRSFINIGRRLWKLPIGAISMNHRTFIQSCVCYRDKFSRSPSKFTKINKTQEGVELDETEADIDTQSPEYTEKEFQELADRAFRVNESGHNVLVIQPYIKWGSGKRRNTTPELQLAESVTLIKTLQNWTVVDKMTISLMTLERTTFFGQGNIDMLSDLVHSDSRISAIFLSVDILKGGQRGFLEKVFKVPVFDRYSIVIKIFREHATSREAKLQLKLAEIPYIRGNIKYLQPQHHFSGGSGETFLEFRRNLLKEKEKAIKKEIENLKDQRALLRRKRQKAKLPVVAVVGYTNAGKTSLIKALTGEESILAKNVLFHTLDVTVHTGILPSGMKVLFVDTIGFISDIPTLLLQSFVATLEDALLADVVLHVRDASHPDFLAQLENVNSTLQSFNLSESLLENIVEVGNKIDLVENIDKEHWSNCILTSAVKLKGIEEVKEAVEAAILKATGRQRMEIRVRTGGEEYMWLQRETTVSQMRADPKDSQYCFLLVIIAPHILAKFKHHFILNKQ